MLLLLHDNDQFLCYQVCDLWLPNNFWIHISELVVTFCHSHIIISMFYHIFRLFFLFQEIINPIYPVYHCFQSIFSVSFSWVKLSICSWLLISKYYWVLILFIYSLLTCTFFHLITLFIIILLTHLVLNTFLIITDLLATIPILFPFLLAHLTVTCNLAMNLFFID